MSPPLHTITPWMVFELADPLQQGLMVALVLAMVAALIVLVRKLSRGVDGASAYLSGLRLGGPVIGCLGASFSPLSMTLGYASVPGDLPLKVLAPGFAQAFLEIGLGSLAGVVAVCAHWAVEARIDRQVLGA
jgi:hypothetical protein